MAIFHSSRKDDHGYSGAKSAFGCSLPWLQGSEQGTAEAPTVNPTCMGKGWTWSWGTLGGQGSDTSCPGINCQAPLCSGQLSSKAESCQDPKFTGKEFQVHLLIALTWSTSILHFADSSLELHPLLEDTRLDFSAKAWCQCTPSLYTMAAPSWRSIWIHSPGLSRSKAFCSSSMTADAVAPAGSLSGCLNRVKRHSQSGRIMTRFGCPDLKV